MKTNQKSSRKTSRDTLAQEALELGTGNPLAMTDIEGAIEMAEETVAVVESATRQPSRKELATLLRKSLAAHSRDPKHALSGLTFEVRKAWLDNGPEAVKTAAVDVTVKNPPTKGLESDRATAEADIAHFVKIAAEATGIAVSSIEFGEAAAS